MPELFEAAVNTARLCLVLFLHLCHVKYCRPVDHPSAGSSRLNDSGIIDLGHSWGRDLELMHHYTTVTSNTMAQQEAARHVWRVGRWKGYLE